MKTWIRTRYTGSQDLYFGHYGNLVPGCEFSIHWTDWQFMEQSHDGLPKILEKLGEDDEKREYMTPKMIESAKAPSVPERPKVPESPVDWSSKTIAELKAACSEKGIEIPKGATKAGLVDLLSKTA